MASLFLFPEQTSGAWIFPEKDKVQNVQIPVQ
jgi:hypothetical protein